MDNLKSKLLNITSSISKTSGELVKNTKLNFDLANEEEKLKSIYLEIGKKVHEIYAYGGNLGEAFDQKYKEILKVEYDISVLKEKINVLKGVKSCLKCGKQVEKKNEFCPYCGSSMLNAPDYRPEGATDVPVGYIEQNQSDNIEVQEAEGVFSKPDLSPVKICPSCGGKNDLTSRFCLGCGRVLG